MKSYFINDKSDIHHGLLTTCPHAESNIMCGFKISPSKSVFAAPVHRVPA